MRAARVIPTALLAGLFLTLPGTLPGIGRLGGPPTAEAATAASAAEQMLALVNAERRKAGCAAVRLDPRLTSAASKHSADMATNDYFSHTGRNGTGFATRMEAAGHSTPTVGEHRRRQLDRSGDLDPVDGQCGTPPQHPRLLGEGHGRRSGHRPRVDLRHLLDAGLRARVGHPSPTGSPSRTSLAGSPSERNTARRAPSSHDVVAFGSGQAPVRCDDHVQRVAGARDRPRAGDPSVDQQEPRALHGQSPVRVVDDPGTVVEAEHGVVERGEEPDRRRGVRVGQRGVGKIEQGASRARRGTSAVAGAAGPPRRAARSTPTRPGRRRSPQDRTRPGSAAREPRRRRACAPRARRRARP